VPVLFCSEIVPKLPLWYLRVPEILRHLESPGAPPFLDRPAIERLFGVRRRQAIRLLGAAQGYQVGKTFLVERQALVDFLAGFENSGAAPEARARKRRVSAALNEVANHAAAQRIQVQASPDVFRRRPADLPAAIELVAVGKLQISYRGAEDLLAQIVELAAAAANDFPAFRRLYEAQK
jgi:hypothetical protein